VPSVSPSSSPEPAPTQVPLLPGSPTEAPAVPTVGPTGAPSGGPRQAEVPSKSPSSAGGGETDSPSKSPSSAGGGETNSPTTGGKATVSPTADWIRSTNELSPMESDDNSLQWWVIVAVAAGVCGCGVIALLLWRRCRKQRVMFKDFVEAGMGGHQKFEGDKYAILEEQEMKGFKPKTLESATPKAAQASGERRFNTKPHTTVITVAPLSPLKWSPYQPRASTDRSGLLDERRASGSVVAPIPPIQPRASFDQSGSLLPSPKVRNASSGEERRASGSGLAPISPYQPRASVDQSALLLPSPRVRNASKGSYSGEERRASGSGVAPIPPNRIDRSGLLLSSPRVRDARKGSWQATGSGSKTASRHGSSGARSSCIVTI